MTLMDLQLLDHYAQRFGAEKVEHALLGAMAQSMLVRPVVITDTKAVLERVFGALDGEVLTHRDEPTVCLCGKPFPPKGKN